TLEPTPEPILDHTQLEVRKAYRGYGLGPAAPAESLPFPTNAHLTLVELVTFLPNSIRCADVIYRLISNGGTRQALWAIVNTQRDLPVELSQNCCGAWMYKSMKKAGYNGWTIKTHDRFHSGRKATWEESRLDVNFRIPRQRKRESTQVPDIPFKALAVDVRIMPQGDDALDLTRMVQYCIQEPSNPWMYPRDYDALLGVLGGPAAVQKEHSDRAAFGRWAGVMPPPPRYRAPDYLLTSQEEPEPEKKRKRMDSLRGNIPVMSVLSREEVPALKVRSRQTTPAIPVQPKRRGWPKSRPRKSNIEEGATPQPGDMEETTDQPYIRDAAEYIASPSDGAEPVDEQVNLAFLKEGSRGQSDPFSPYAFGGPRCSPPFRLLHHIAQPDPQDSSGWAENLRWAYEQCACFWYSFRTDTWNESPEHMEFIAKTRKEQLWASEELLELL
ncbi:uncharacterized protein K460DRAFT_267174, partial [Cucurbitaria berberidis CBS 394.84]